MIRYLSVIIFLFSASINISQTFEFAGKKPEFKFESLSNEQGLSQSNVRCIRQDKQTMICKTISHYSDLPGIPFRRDNILEKFPSILLNTSGGRNLTTNRNKLSSMKGWKNDW